MACFQFPEGDEEERIRNRAAFIKKLLARIEAEREWHKDLDGPENDPPRYELFSVTYVAPADLEEYRACRSPGCPLGLVYWILGIAGRRKTRRDRLRHVNVHSSPWYFCTVNIHSTVHSAEDLARWISEISGELELDMPRNPAMTSWSDVANGSREYDC